MIIPETEYSLNPLGGTTTQTGESSLLLSFKKEGSSFLKKRSKRLLFVSG
jgi:hypothetical protein